MYIKKFKNIFNDYMENISSNQIIIIHVLCIIYLYYDYLKVNWYQ